jgi:hypothetical protein
MFLSDGRRRVAAEAQTRFVEGRDAYPMIVALTAKGGVMRKGRRKALVLVSFVLVVVALAGMVSVDASQVCVQPGGRGACVLVGETWVYPGAKAHGVITYTGPMVGGHVLLECSHTDNDQLHANFYFRGSWVAYNPTFDRQICS